MFLKIIRREIDKYPERRTDNDSSIVLLASFFRSNFKRRLVIARDIRATARRDIAIYGTDNFVNQKCLFIEQFQIRNKRKSHTKVVVKNPSVYFRIFINRLSYKYLSNCQRSFSVFQTNLFHIYDMCKFKSQFSSRDSQTHFLVDVHTVCTCNYISCARSNEHR